MGNSNKVHFPSTALTLLVENPRVSLFISAITRKVELKRIFKKQKTLIRSESFKYWQETLGTSNKRKSEISAALEPKPHISVRLKIRKQSRTISKVRQLNKAVPQSTLNETTEEKKCAGLLFKNWAIIWNKKLPEFSIHCIAWTHKKNTFVTSKNSKSFSLHICHYPKCGTQTHIQKTENAYSKRKFQIARPIRAGKKGNLEISAAKTTYKRSA